MASWWGVNSSFILKPFGGPFPWAVLFSLLLLCPSNFAVSLTITRIPLWSQEKNWSTSVHPCLLPTQKCLGGSEVSVAWTLSPHIIQAAYGRAQLNEHKSVEWQLGPPLIPNKFWTVPQTWEALDNWWCSQHLAKHLCLIGYPEIFTLCLMVTEEIDHPILGIYPKRVYKILWSC